MTRNALCCFLYWCVFVSLLLFSPTLVHSEVLMEIEFDLSESQQLPTGFSAVDSVNEFLQSKNMKWLRYFNNVIGSKPGPVRVRTAHMCFKDMQTWALFVEENQNKMDALFDHFWMNTRRVMWQMPEATSNSSSSSNSKISSSVVKNASSVKFPNRTRSEGMGAGYVFQVLYTPFREQDFNEEWNRVVDPFVKELEENVNFLERKHYVSSIFQSQYRHLIQYEFGSLASLMQSMYGKVYIDMTEKLSKHLREYAINIMTPGATDGVYWPAGGADTVLKA